MLGMHNYFLIPELGTKLSMRGVTRRVDQTVIWFHVHLSTRYIHKTFGPLTGSMDFKAFKRKYDSGSRIHVSFRCGKILLRKTLQKRVEHAPRILLSELTSTREKSSSRHFYTMTMDLFLCEGGCAEHAARLNLKVKPIDPIPKTIHSVQPVP